MWKIKVYFIYCLLLTFANCRPIVSKNELEDVTLKTDSRMPFSASSHDMPKSNQQSIKATNFNRLFSRLVLDDDEDYEDNSEEYEDILSDDVPNSRGDSLQALYKSTTSVYPKLERSDDTEITATSETETREETQTRTESDVIQSYLRHLTEKADDNLEENDTEDEDAMTVPQKEIVRGLSANTTEYPSTTYKPEINLANKGMRLNSFTSSNNEAAVPSFARLLVGEEVKKISTLNLIKTIMKIAQSEDSAEGKYLSYFKEGSSVENNAIEIPRAEISFKPGDKSTEVGKTLIEKILDKVINKFVD